MSLIASIQLSKASRLYEYNAGKLSLAIGDRVVVETDKGTTIGTVARTPLEREDAGGSFPMVKRLATAGDIETLEKIAQKEQDAYRFCLTRIKERNLAMKLVQVEYQFDGSKAVFFFTADGRIDFRDLVKDMAQYFHTRIEMRQIGVRDEAKMIGGISTCGRELCCSSFLREFQPVSVKMAKEQNLALNPNKISGQCGRLLCCLDYEYETYCCLRKNYPKSGKRIRTVNAVGVIDKINILTGNISLRLDDGKVVVIKRDEIIDDTASDAAPTATAPQKTAAPAAVSAVTGGRSDKWRKNEKTSLEMYTKNEVPARHVTLPDPEDALIVASEIQKVRSRKRKRSRKHGHKNRSGTTQTDTSGA